MKTFIKRTILSVISVSSTLMTTRGLVALLLLFTILVCPISAEAAKKKKGDGDKEAAKIEAEVKAAVDPIDKDLNKLLLKVQSRGLFSPDDAGKLAGIKYKLVDLMNQYPKNAQIVKPIYQAGMVYIQREEFLDSYELLQFVSLNFPENPYGLKAKSQITQMEKKLGKDYFPQDLAPDVPSPTANKDKPKGVK